MKKDNNKDITQIDYNYLKLPEQITLTSGRWIKYEYDANGVKLKKTLSTGKVIDYEEDDIYENGVLYQTAHDEGRIVDGIYEYDIKDHLGNLRVSFKDSLGITKITQVNAYGAFGDDLPTVKYINSLKKNNFTYSTYEKEDDFGIGVFDAHARAFDPITPRFWQIDVLSELATRFSPFSYCLNNPLRYTDPDGRMAVAIDDYFSTQGKYLGSDGAKTDNVRIIETKTWNENKVIDGNGKESIDNQVGNQNSQKFSEAKIDTKSALNVYEHYNPTGLKLKAIENKRVDGSLGGGMAFTTLTVGNKLKEKFMAISVQGNYRSGFADHASEITNIFSHEDQHYKDFKTLGVSKFLNVSVPLLEQRAIHTQMEHSSFIGTRPYFKRVVDAYSKQFNNDPTQPTPPLK